MSYPNILFKDHFRSKLISDNEICWLSAIHQQILSSKNGVWELTQNIADTQNAHLWYFGSLKGCNPGM